MICLYTTRVIFFRNKKGTTESALSEMIFSVFLVLLLLLSSAANRCHTDTFAVRPKKKGHRRLKDVLKRKSHSRKEKYRKTTVETNGRRHWGSEKVANEEFFSQSIRSHKASFLRSSYLMRKRQARVEFSWEEKKNENSLNAGNQVGCQREFVLAAGSMLFQQLLHAPWMGKQWLLMLWCSSLSQLKWLCVVCRKGLLKVVLASELPLNYTGQHLMSAM